MDRRKRASEEAEKKRLYQFYYSYLFFMKCLKFARILLYQYTIHTVHVDYYRGQYWMVCKFSSNNINNTLLVQYIS